MDWLAPYLQDEKVGSIALAVLGGALSIAVLMTLVLAWFSWRASRLARLARRFYAFAAVPWLPFDRAVQRARRLGRPLHAVVLFGALDDESC